MQRAGEPIRGLTEHGVRSPCSARASSELLSYGSQRLLQAIGLGLLRLLLFFLFGSELGLVAFGFAFVLIFIGHGMGLEWKW